MSASGAPPPRCRRRRRGQTRRIRMVVGRTPSRRGGLQPFIEAMPDVYCSCSKSAAKIARVGCSLRRPDRDGRIGLAEAPAPLIPHKIPSSKILNALTVCARPRQYNETVAIAGLLGRIAGLPGSVRVADTPCSKGPEQRLSAALEQCEPLAPMDRDGGQCPTNEPALAGAGSVAVDAFSAALVSA
jgi:hypothetical protein